MPARTPPEQFVAQVRLRLPPRSLPAPGRARLRQAAGLWLPLGVLALWAFFQAALLVGSLVLAALPVAMPLVLPPLPGLGALPLLTVLAGPQAIDAIAAPFVLDACLTVVAAVLVWGCLAGWWATRETSFVPSGEQAGR